ncbi:glyoxylase-like metal-dependent hydrolase (beta-lactamase superfamily II) [Antricoccus suffuscus]|uniref:Glyoxylase-like metal-dependent hydrolase (Beta-lactamase superfamily II) n=1 Tax=Antricoccus suffuscus TaxID=1629062 RepID=A0A2T1A7N4_9ACTN|nr:MBL fold metallo-hydrolase [Antricoccus suffuscus]PRZ44348.1 glyoxylase-like metal-dependent hydrolase (beta-lactamase superfamily II) [Antricoccus suffuscus]
MKIGDLDIIPISDGTATEQGREILSRPGVEDPWACHPDVLDADGALHFDLGGFLLRTGDRTILIDAGVGRIDNGQYVGGGFLDSLAAAGVQPDQVTDVVLTHLHFDHVGWTTSRGAVVFPNATYRAHRADWDHFVEAPDALPGAVKKLTPLKNQLDLFDSEHTIAPGLDARPAPGHTPGSTVYVVSSGAARALMLGDVVHSVVELAEPDWEAVFDVDPTAASAVRNTIADEVLDTDTLVAPAHFPGLAFGRVVTTSSGRRWTAI